MDILTSLTGVPNMVTKGLDTYSQTIKTGGETTIASLKATTDLANSAAGVANNVTNVIGGVLNARQETTRTKLQLENQIQLRELSMEEQERTFKQNLISTVAIQELQSEMEFQQDLKKLYRYYEKGKYTKSQYYEIRQELIRSHQIQSMLAKQSLSGTLYGGIIVQAYPEVQEAVNRSLEAAYPRDEDGNIISVTQQITNDLEKQKQIEEQDRIKLLEFKRQEHELLRLEYKNQKLRNALPQITSSQPPLLLPASNPEWSDSETDTDEEKEATVLMTPTPKQSLLKKGWDLVSSPFKTIRSTIPEEAHMSSSPSPIHSTFYLHLYVLSISNR